MVGNCSNKIQTLVKKNNTHYGSNKDIINWFANVVRGFLSYYRYCDNLYQIWTIVDYHICWSAIFTLANNYKSSTHKIIPKHSKDLHIVHGEDGTLVSFPASIELRTLRLEFLTKANINKEPYKKSNVHMIMKCDQFELLCGKKGSPSAIALCTQVGPHLYFFVNTTVISKGGRK